MGRKCTIKLYYQQLPLHCFKNCIEVSDCHTHTGLFKPELPLHTGIRIKIDMKLKTHSQKEIAPGEARTHGLQIMRLTRCLLRYGGNYVCRYYLPDPAMQRVRGEVKIFNVPTGGLEPPIFGLGDRRLIH